MTDEVIERVACFLAEEFGTGGANNLVISYDGDPVDTYAADGTPKHFEWRDWLQPATKLVEAAISPGDRLTLGGVECRIVPDNPCLAKLREGEPFFVLLGRDKDAAHAIRCWADARDQSEGTTEWADDARRVADLFDAYRVLSALSPKEPT